MSLLLIDTFIRKGEGEINGQYDTGDVVLGNWTLTRLIGEGSYGRVFEARREDFGASYTAAIKILTIPQSQSEVHSARAEGMSEKNLTEYFLGFVKEIVHEFEIMAKLKGTANIVSYEDHAVIPHSNGRIGWDIFIRMEYLTPLFDYARSRPISRLDVIRLGIDMCRALELCQKFNIIHRDIKPENILVSALGDFKLGDFGIARTIENTTACLSKKGTYTYMAPEVYLGGKYDSSVDIYSLGIVLYRLLNNNRAPFLPDYPTPITPTDREKALTRRFSGASLPKPANADGRLAKIVLRACAFEPRARYHSPMQLRSELEAMLHEGTGGKSIHSNGDGINGDEIDFNSNGYASSNASGKVDRKSETLRDGKTTRKKATRTFRKKTTRTFRKRTTRTSSRKSKSGLLWLAVTLAVAVLLAVFLPERLKKPEPVRSYYADGSYVETEYGKNGEMIKETTYTSGGEPVVAVSYYADGSVMGRTESEYTEDGALLRETIVHSDGSSVASEFDGHGKKVKESTYGVKGEQKYSKDYEYDKDGNLSVAVIHYADGSRTENSFDKNGNLMSDEGYSVSGIPIFKVKYEYSDDGKLIRKTTDFYSETGDQSDRSQCEYGDGEKLVKITFYSAFDGTYTVTEYASNGKEARLSRYNADGSAIRHEEYQYDENGNKSQTVIRNPDGAIENRIKYEYNEYGYMVKETTFAADGSPTTETEHEYDENGHEIKTVSYTAEGFLRYHIEHEYDENGNEIKKVSYASDGEISSWYEFEYDENGQYKGMTCYDAEGNVTGRY